MITDAEVEAALDEWMGQARLFMFNQFFGVENEVESESVRRERLRPWMRAALTAARAVAEGWRPTHQHIKSGGLYRVVTRGEIEADLTPAVVYDDANGRVWIRPAAEFDEGRFHPLPAAPKEAG